MKSAIESVLNQSYNNFEYILLDDCSKDDSWKIIKEYDDPRIVAVRNENNIGEYANREKAIRMARGEYLIFIDGDDIMYSNALQNFDYYISRYGGTSMVIARNWDPRIIYPYVADCKTIYQFEFLDQGILGGNFTKVLFRRAAIDKACPFPVGIKSGDSYIQLKVGMTDSALIVSDGFTWWRKRTGNATQSLFSSYRYLAEFVNLRIGLLDHKECPLSEDHRYKAKIRVYGLYLRILIRLFAKLKWGDFFYLTGNIRVPFGYYKAVFIGSNKNYFNTYNGDRPLFNQDNFAPSGAKSNNKNAGII